MNRSLISQHIGRVWRQHWALQLATVTVMSLILVLFNLLLAGVNGANTLLYQWGQGLEMVVYLKDNISTPQMNDLRERLEKSQQFSDVHFTSKQSATEAFLVGLGKESLNLLKDPKWSSPLPASFEVRMVDNIGMNKRVDVLREWSAQLKPLEFVDDVFYGQGWIENFSHFVGQAKMLITVLWILCLVVGLLIVGNCIRLSFLRRKEDIEILELVGATPGFIRLPYVAEGIFIGIVSSLISILLSFALHASVLQYLKREWTFWSQWQALSPLELWMVLTSIVLGIAFGALGAWICVRKLNTGWSASQGAR